MSGLEVAWTGYVDLVCLSCTFALVTLSEQSTNVNLHMPEYNTVQYSWAVLDVTDENC